MRVRASEPDIDVPGAGLVRTSKRPTPRILAPDEILALMEPHLDPPALDPHPIGQVRQLRAHALGRHLEPDPGQPGLLEFGG